MDVWVGGGYATELSFFCSFWLRYGVGHLVFLQEFFWFKEKLNHEAGADKQHKGGGEVFSFPLPEVRV